MKALKNFSLLFILFTLLLNFSSCLVVESNGGGGHRGWYKNSNNPHNPASTNPGRGHGNGRGHSK